MPTERARIKKYGTGSLPIISSSLNKYVLALSMIPNGLNTYRDDILTVASYFPAESQNLDTYLQQYQNPESLGEIAEIPRVDLRELDPTFKQEVVKPRFNRRQFGILTARAEQK